MNTEDFYYELPPELIAQTPALKRESSRLLALNRKTGEIKHAVFSDITNFLNAGDVLVINDTRVIPARLRGVKEHTGAEIEVLLLRRLEDGVWETIVRPGRRVKAGVNIIFGSGQLCAQVIGIEEDGCRLLRFDCKGGEFFSIIDRIGSVPLPPYITEPSTDSSRYQTVYARENGSAAAPTAGLHFTRALLDELRQKGVKIASVMLHVGLGTFRPVKEKKIQDHMMHSEYFEVSAEAADIINSRTGRIVAVGTTSCRTLESAADENGVIHAVKGDTGIFIYPGYRFRATDALITNYHLPQSTLLMLVSAFSTREIVMSAYAEAIKEGYRFFSYGDAMFLY
ncbi:MAG: tRNA preQ1(34) S-adenosylmethionine ribosyltransferase-isomerase QueA [Eubacteriales bacterium]|nr:tRNA preQ1(34) S-adenosylmethionine ribosyltransferase-isomerase QueA [Eubacteriales bacterium]